MGDIESLLKRYGHILGVLVLVVQAVFVTLNLDDSIIAWAVLVTSLVFAIIILYGTRSVDVLDLDLKIPVVTFRQTSLRRQKVYRGLAVVSILVCIGWAYLLLQRDSPAGDHPSFEITAFDTLKSDRNAYELTDYLLWNYDKLGDYGVDITFTIEIRPQYQGNERYGTVIALISGDRDVFPVERVLWDDFTHESNTQQIHLTLEELLYLSGLEENSALPDHSFRLGNLPYQEAKLTIQVIRESDRAHPWASDDIVIRNAPWETYCRLANRNGQREVDVYIKNAGGAGDFTVNYRLVRLEADITSSSSPMLSGVTDIQTWNEPHKLVHLERDGIFTTTVSLPSQLATGRYLLEVYAVKKQNYVHFTDPNATWGDLKSLRSPWWFGRYPYDTLIFIETGGFPSYGVIRTEWERLKTEQGIDLGIALGPIEDITSPRGTAGQRQVFQQGEIYAYNEQAFSIYGPILEHFRAIGGYENDSLSFPISPIQPITSSSGTEGVMMEFEGPGSPHRPTVIYSSSKGTAVVQMWINWVHWEKHGGPAGWLGFPLADEQYSADSTFQMFEYGYISYHYPLVGDERDWGREPVAYPYLASRGTLFDVSAQQGWQSTGIHVAPGDQITIVQINGEWTNETDMIAPFDANGHLEVRTVETSLLPRASVGMLIGRIGEDTEPAFMVGRWGVITVATEGTLYLAMNDEYHDDNGGSIGVQIMIDTSE